MQNLSQLLENSLILKQQCKDIIQITGKFLCCHKKASNALTPITHLREFHIHKRLASLEIDGSISSQNLTIHSIDIFVLF